MTPVEFKAWFDGFSEGIEKQPTQKQWARIKERVAEIEGDATVKIFIDRCPPYHPSYTIPDPAWVSSSVRTMNALGKSEIAELNGG